MCVDLIVVFVSLVACIAATRTVAFPYFSSYFATPSLLLHRNSVSVSAYQCVVINYH
jgi:hypothetical protein